ncbi:putative c6 transcription factor [Phaeomoniella chlamydospora]|uniref:Putative c6 transcription factor n=1 Tax=Phaeomoniella chlamydospora TaxID=158046 RepID=A0A0G2DZE4_PHACM|nr:putative c6 transcription factor [Phaeomoniella chlamydospora]
MRRQAAMYSLHKCTYDQPSNRRRNPAPQYIEALEARLHKAEALLRVALPNVDLDDPKIEACGIEQILAMAERKAPTPTPKIGQLQQPTPTSAIEADDAQLESMVQNTGSLDIDDNGEYNYHGNSSGYAFLRRLRAEMGDSFSLPRSLPHRPPLKSLYMDSRATSESPLDATLPFANVELPPRDVVKALCRNALDDCCALMRFIHQPSFYEKLERLYNTDPDHYTNADMKFLPLIYLVIAVGSMFSTADDNRLDADGYEKYIGQGYQYFNAGRQMIDITDCRDLTGLQTIMLMVIFLQATAKLSTCYAYVGIALRTCMRLGLHRNVSDNMDFIEQQERKRTFWLVKKMDSYVGAMLGLPQMLSEEDIDQEFPAEVNDECITREAILAQPAGQFPLIRATNAHTRLTVILKKVVKYVYPIKGVQSSTNSSQNRGYMISHAKIQEIESDLQAWMEELPIELRPSDDVPADLSR